MLLIIIILYILSRQIISRSFISNGSVISMLFYYPLSRLVSIFHNIIITSITTKTCISLLTIPFISSDQIVIIDLVESELRSTQIFIWITIYSPSYTPFILCTPSIRLSFRHYSIYNRLRKLQICFW